MTKVPGLEATHTWNGQVALNSNQGGMPRFRLDRIGGLHSLPDIEDNREPAQGRIGERAWPSLFRGRTVTYEGRIFAATLNDLRVAESDLKAAFGTTAEGQMVINYAPGYAPGAGFAFFYHARCVQLEIPDEQAVAPYALPTPFQRPFVVALRMSDPRFYRSQLQTYNTGSLGTGGIGGIIPPITPPIVLVAAGLGGSAVVTNGGNAPTDPVITLVPGGTTQGPNLTNQTIDKKLQFKDALTIEAGINGDIVIDFKQRTIQEIRGTGPPIDLRYQLDIPNSTWWDEGVPGLVPGQNTIIYNGTAIEDPAYAEIRFYNANF